MSSENPTLAELGITGPAAVALEAVDLNMRTELEAFGLESLEVVKGIGDVYADDIREKVAASYSPPEPVEPEAAVAEVEDPVVEAATEAEPVETLPKPELEPIIEETPAPEPELPSEPISEPAAVPEPTPEPTVEPEPEPVTEPVAAEPAPISSEPTVPESPSTVSGLLFEEPIDDLIENARLERITCYALNGILAGVYANVNPAAKMGNEADRAKAARLHADAVIAEIDGC